jgi:hypothetical protein
MRNLNKFFSSNFDEMCFVFEKIKMNESFLDFTYCEFCAKITKFFFIRSPHRLGPRELTLSVEPHWITDTLPPNNTNSASTAQLSQQQQSKIMNVVVPNAACTAASKKIRRKTENKVSPSAVINFNCKPSMISPPLSASIPNQ